MSGLRQRPGDQPLPRTEDPQASGMHDKAIALLLERKSLGLTRYGTTLQAFNGRDALQDAVEEVTDLLVYLLQVRDERDDTVGAARLAAERDETRERHQRDLDVIHELGRQLRALMRALKDGRGGDEAVQEIRAIADRLARYGRADS